MAVWGFHFFQNFRKLSEAVSLVVLGLIAPAVRTLMQRDSSAPSLLLRKVTKNASGGTHQPQRRCCSLGSIPEKRWRSRSRASDTA